MGGIGDFLFGGSGGVESKKTDRMTPEQMDVLNKMSTQVGDQIGQGGPVYDGAMTAGASDLQNQAFGNISDMMNQGLNTGNAVTTMGPTGVPLVNAPGQDMNAIRSGWEEQFLNPAMQQFNNDIAPQIMQKFAGMNASDSRGLNAELGRAGGNMNTQLQGILAGMMSEERKRGQDFKFQADSMNTGRQIASDESYAARDLQGQGMELDRLFNVPGLQAQFANLGLTAGGQQRDIDQQFLNEDMQKWDMAQAYNNPMVNNYLQTILGANPYQIDTIASQGGGGMLGGLMGGIGKGAGEGIGTGIANMF